MKARGVRVGAITNVMESAVARLSGDSGVIYTHAGPEIGVASTKAFTTQMVSLHLLAVGIDRTLGTLSVEEATAELEALRHLPHWMEQASKEPARWLSLRPGPASSTTISS